MSTPAEELDRIEDNAAEWLAEREEGLSSARLREFDRWCRADPRHAAAVARLEQACALLGEMPQVRGELLPVVEFPALRAPEISPSPPPRVAWPKIFAGLPS